MGRITEIQGNNGEKKNYTYDALGNVTSMTDGKERDEVRIHL